MENSTKSPEHPQAGQRRLHHSQAKRHPLALPRQPTQCGEEAQGAPHAPGSAARYGQRAFPGEGHLDVSPASVSTTIAEVSRPAEDRQALSKIASKQAYGSEHTYVVKDDGTSSTGRRGSSDRTSTGGQAGRVQVALDIDELAQLDEMTIKRKYQEQIEAEKDQRDLEREERPKKRRKGKRKD
eukprot:575391_1